MLTKVDNAMEAKPIPVRKNKNHVYVYDTVVRHGVIIICNRNRL
jgi:hypothetical protein